MNDDLQSYIEPELEARIVALVLGEASAFEEGELEKLIAERSELQAYRERIEKVHGVVGEAHREVDDEEWKLSDEKREVILSRYRKTAQAEVIEKRRERGSRRAQRNLIYACAACLLLTLIFGGMLMPMGVKKEGQLIAESAKAEPVSREAMLAELDEELIAQSDRVQDHRKDLTVLTQQYGIPYFDGRKANPLGATEEDLFANSRQKLEEFRTQKKQIEGQLKELIAKGDDDLVTYAAGLDLPENQVTEQLSKYREALNEKRSLVGKGLSTKHPEVIEVEKRASGAIELARKEAVELKDVLKTKLQLVDRQVDRMEEFHDYRQGDTVDLSLRQHTYTQAKETYEQSREMLREMKVKQNEARYALGLPLIEEQEAAKATLSAAASLAELDAVMPATGAINAWAVQEEMEREGQLWFRAKEASESEPKDAARPGDLDRLAALPSELPTSAEMKKFGDDFGTNSPNPVSPEPTVAKAPKVIAAAAIEADDLEGKFDLNGKRDSKNLTNDSYAFWDDGQKQGGKRGKFDSKDQSKALDSGIVPGGAMARKSKKRSLKSEALDSDNDGFRAELQLEKKSETPGLVEQENMRRQARVVEADEALMEGRKAYAEGDYEGAVEKYRKAVEILPPGTATASRKKVLNEHLSDGAIALGQEYRRNGRYDEAKELLKEVEKADLGSAVAEKGLAYLDDPIRANLHIDPLAEKERFDSESVKNVDKLRRSFFKGEGLYDLGLYDKAEEEFKDILRIDPYNKGARRWMERLSGIKSDYYRAAYDQTRAKMLMKVDRAWELEVPELSDDESAEFEGVGEKTLNAKLKQIVVPEVDFSNAAVEDVLDFVRLRSIELDNTTLDPQSKGVNVVGYIADGHEVDSLRLKNVSLKEILDQLVNKTGLHLEVGDFEVTLSEKEVDSWTPEKVEGEVSDQTGTALVVRALSGVALKDISIKEAIASIEKKYKESHPDGNELRFEISNQDVGELRVDHLELNNVPLSVILQHLAEKSRSRYRIDGKRIIFYSDALPNPKPKDAAFETLVSEKSDSTFSLNVSDVSFKLTKAALAEGNWPDAAKVRAEEFVNALDYDDQKPNQSEKVASVIEQGAHPFMPQRNLMRIAMSTASLGRNAATPLRLTILLDQSGSMERADRAESVKRAFALLAAQLTKTDEVTLIGFARTPRLLAERMKGDEAKKLSEIVANPLTEGGTNLEAALSSGLQMARQQFLAEAQNRIILITDGAANLGDALPKNLSRQVASMRKLGIAFDACGVGADGLNDEVLSSLAKQGDGRYYFLDRPEDADAGFAKQIAGALRPAAKNVKVQILFNPERVSKFKLYGFEKHKLKKQDFRNDSVDAAEMAAEESGVALYHFEPIADGEGDVGTVSVRFLDTASGEMVERTWGIPYEPEVVLFSEAKASLRLAATAGLFAEKLKGSAVGERVELKKLRQEMELLTPTFDLQPRFHELKNMLQQAGE